MNETESTAAEQLRAANATIERLKRLNRELEAIERLPIKRVEQSTPRNCGQACLAMVFDVSIDEVPAGAAAETWNADEVQEWLSQWGLQEIRVKTLEGSIWPARGVRCIVDGPSPRGEKIHAVVATMEGPCGWVLDADPHPENNGLADEPYSVTFFAVKDPAMHRKNLARIAELQERLEAAEMLLKACKSAEDAMCQATFNLNGKRCGDLNHAIDLTRKAIKGWLPHTKQEDQRP